MCVYECWRSSCLDLIFGGVCIQVLRSPAIVGSLEILGNPTRLVRSITKVCACVYVCVCVCVRVSATLVSTRSLTQCCFIQGVRDLFVLPSRALRARQGPKRVIQAALSGWGSLVHHLSEGALTSVSGLASSLSRNLDRLSLDEECVPRTLRVVHVVHGCACSCHMLRA